jgi:hypothetical protein
MSRSVRSGAVVGEGAAGAQTGTAGFDPLPHVSCDPARTPQAVELLV